MIEFFRLELARLHEQLTAAEDSLIQYNIDHRIINYGEQTKMVAVMDADHKGKQQEILLNNTTSKALADFFEHKLGNQADIFHLSYNVLSAV